VQNKTPAVGTNHDRGCALAKDRTGMSRPTRYRGAQGSHRYLVDLKRALAQRLGDHYAHANDARPGDRGVSRAGRRRRVVLRCRRARTGGAALMRHPPRLREVTKRASPSDERLRGRPTRFILSSSPRGRQKVGDNLDLVGAHQGRRLTVTSEPGKGSEFTVRLPGGAER
jgi:hypothetical protein